MGTNQLEELTRLQKQNDRLRCAEKDSVKGLPKCEFELFRQNLANGRGCKKVGSMNLNDPDRTVSLVFRLRYGQQYPLAIRQEQLRNVCPRLYLKDSIHFAG